MKVTVGIITKDRVHQLRRCLSSLTKQTNKSFNILVVDSSADDKTKKVVNSFKKKLKIRYVFEKKLGYSNARNRVIIEANCEILSFIDDDCEATSDWIENISRAHKQFPEAIAIQGWAISKPKNAAISIMARFIHESSFKENINSDKEIFSNLNNRFLQQPNKILLLATKNASFKLYLLKKLKLEFNTKVIHAEDFEFAKQILSKKQKIVFVPDIVVYHWERSTLRQFLQQRKDVSGEIKKAQHKWPANLFPERNTLWWVGRGGNFLIYLLVNKHITRSYYLIPLFILERITTIFGRYAS